MVSVAQNIQITAVAYVTVRIFNERNSISYQPKGSTKMMFSEVGDPTVTVLTTTADGIKILNATFQVMAATPALLYTHSTFQRYSKFDISPCPCFALII